MTIISVDRRIPENDIFIIKPFVNNTYHPRCRSVVQLNEHYTTTTTTFLCPISILQLEVSADTDINPIPSFQVLLLRWCLCLQHVARYLRYRIKRSEILTDIGAILILILLLCGIYIIFHNLSYSEILIWKFENLSLRWDSYGHFVSCSSISVSLDWWSFCC